MPSINFAKYASNISIDNYWWPTFEPDQQSIWLPRPVGATETYNASRSHEVQMKYQCMPLLYKYNQNMSNSELLSSYTTIK